MTPTKEQILARLHRLPPNLRQVAQQALLHFTPGDPSAPPPQHLPGAGAGAGPPSIWPGYLWYLRTSPIWIVEDIALRGNYWLLGHEERKTIRDRLNWSSEELIRKREEARNGPRLALGDELP
jgi:hypothetical protein